MSNNDNNNSSAPGKVPAGGPGGVRTSRRRLLKAGAAAPVVYTLASGSALAAMSQGCDLKPGNLLMVRQKNKNHVWVGGTGNQHKHRINADGTVTINGQTFVLDGNELITQSCWSSLTPGSKSGRFY